MLNTDTINKYLEDNALPPDEGYLLKDSGSGNFIAEWDLGIDEPTTEQLDAITIIVNLANGWKEVKELQQQMLSPETEAAWRIARYTSQNALHGQSTKENPAKIQDLLQYAQDVRDCDELATPELAIAALNALTTPSE